LVEIAGRNKDNPPGYTDPNASTLKEAAAELTNYHDNSSQATIRPIELEDRTTIASSSNPIPVQVSGLSKIRSDNFIDSANSVLNEMDQYFKYAETSAYPKIELQQGLYNVITNRLLRLSQVNDEEYNNLINNPIFNQRVEKFINHEKVLFPVDAYNEVVKATEIEKDV
jgi:hypothetical protein